MDLSKSMADKSCRIPTISAAGAALRVHALIPNCAQTGGFRRAAEEPGAHIFAMKEVDQMTLTARHGCARQPRTN
jgi:hypothetical protein